MSALPPPLELPPKNGPAGVTVRWLGAAGFEIRCGEHALLIDPYVTRAPLSRCLLSPLVPDEVAIAGLLPRADAIVVGRTHFDHVLDVPSVARRTGAKVYGSRSAANLCRMGAVPEAQIIDVESRRLPFEAECGPFALRFFPSAHSRLVFGRVPLPGDIDDCDAVPMRLNHYRCGAVFSVEVRIDGRRLVHLGSAETVEGSVPPEVRDADLLLLCVAGWTKSDRFPERVMRAFSPRAVLLSHWDDFFRSAREPARALPGLKLPRLVDRLHEVAREVPLGSVPLLGELVL